MEWLILIFMFVLIAFGLPIAVAIMVSSLIGVYAIHGPLGFINAALSLYDGASSFPLIAIPLFIFAGALMNTGGISKRLINFASSIVGFMRGGLAMVNVVVSMFFAEISGSAVADVAAVGSVIIPQMKRKKYKAKLAAAVTSSSASLAVIIPPSIPMILYGAMSDTSIVQLFIAGVIPGILGGFLMMLLCYRLAVKFNLPREKSFDIKNVWQHGKEAGWALLLPLIILGGIFGGIVTATEGAGLAILAALIIGVFIYREIRLKNIYQALVEGILQTATVMLLVATSAVLGLYLTETQMPQKLAQFITQVSTEKFVILFLLNLFLLFIGTVLHGAAAIVLTVPVFLPLVHQIGIDPVQFGLILTLSIAIGQQTPPVASVLVTACAIADSDIWKTSKANVPFVGILLLILMMVTYLPGLPLALVEYLYR